MTGKRSDSTPRPNDAAGPRQPLTKVERARLEAELAYHDESAAALERNGNTKTYHHERAAAIRAALADAELSEVNDGELD